MRSPAVFRFLPGIYYFSAKIPSASLRSAVSPLQGGEKIERSEI
jgi:hypothetical protein